MAFMQKNEEAVAQDKGGIQVLNESGIFPTTIKLVSVRESKNGATEIVFNLEGPDGVATIYGTYITNAQGSNLDKNGNLLSGYRMLNSLMNILGLDEVSDPEPQEHDFNGTKATLNVLEDFTDKEVYVQLRKIYRKYNGAVTEDLRIQRFYRATDGATGSEILEGTEPKQMEKDRAYAVDKLDGVTPEEVAAYEAAGGKRAAKKAGSGSSAPAEKKASPFGKKA